MTDKQEYQDVNTKVVEIQTAVGLLDGLIELTADSADPEVLQALNQINLELALINIWATEHIQQLEGEEVINSFMQELKTLLTNFSASIEIGSASSGYGENYGGTDANSIKFTATQNGVTASRTINSTQMDAGDI